MASSSTSTSTRRHSCAEEKRIIKLLLQGQKSANQLQILLHNSRDHQPEFSTAADGFIHQILTSFTHTIHLIHPNKSKPRNRTSHNYNSSQNTSTKMMDKRGSYKRRRCSETRTNVSPTMEDGQAWRKYGQKVILNSKFPRSYFRCTHKYDQGCNATKQVQIMEDNPQLYQTTYIGFHTCTSHTPPLKLPAPTPTPTPTMFAFSSDETPYNGQQNNNNVSTMITMDDLFSSSDNQQPTLAVKEKEEHNNKEQDDTMSDLTDNHNSSSFPQIHMDLDHISHMYSFGPAFDDVTSQFDHPDFKIDDFFFSDN